MGECVQLRAGEQNLYRLTDTNETARPQPGYSCRALLPLVWLYRLRRGRRAEQIYLRSKVYDFNRPLG
jgi:hypothetical protein